MRKYLIVFCVLWFAFSSVGFAIGQDDFIIKSRLFKGTEQDKNEDSDVVVSLFSVPVLVPFHPNYIQLEKINIHRLKRDLQKIYKIENIDHLASGLMIWDGSKNRINGIVMVKESTYPLFFSPSMLEEGNLNLRVQVSRPRDASGHPQAEGDILDTEMVMRLDTPYVLGFPSGGQKFFLAISVAKKEAGKFGKDEYSQASPDQDMPQIPMPIKKLIPTYPSQLKQEGIGGKVILEVIIDKQGTVTQVTTLSSDHPQLSQSASSALEQWEFAPIMKKNKPISAKFPVIVEFKSNDESGEK
jgi:TonB family protein